MEPLVVAVLVLLAIALAIAAWKLPRLRAGLGGAAAAVAAVAGLLVALASAKGDVRAVKRQIKAKQQLKAAVKDHKEESAIEISAVEEVQAELERMVEENEETPDLQELADSFNDKFAKL